MLIHKLPSEGPFNSLFSLSTRTGLIPKNGLVAEPGFVDVAPGRGVIKIPPVSVCHQVSTIGHLPLPTTLLYQFHASGLIGSPTLPKILQLERLVFFTGSSPSAIKARIAVGAV